PALVYAIGNDATEEGEEEKGNGAGEAYHAQPEGGVGEHKHQPSLSHVLHPGTDVGEEVAAPEDAEVGVAQGTNDGGKMRRQGRSRGIGAVCTQGFLLQFAAGAQNGCLVALV